MLARVVWCDSNKRLNFFPRRWVVWLASLDGTIKVRHDDKSYVYILMGVHIDTAAYVHTYVLRKVFNSSAHMTTVWHTYSSSNSLQHFFELLHS